MTLCLSTVKWQRAKRQEQRVLETPSSMLYAKRHGLIAFAPEDSRLDGRHTLAIQASRRKHLLFFRFPSYFP